MSELLYLRKLLAEYHVLDEDTGCWIWQRYCRNGDSYGQTFHGGRMTAAHRAYYEICIGPIPDGLVIDHLCRNPRCVNPAHLEAVTQQENLRRTRTTHCKRGHPRAGNVSVADERRGFRRCLACRREIEHPRRRERLREVAA